MKTVLPILLLFIILTSCGRRRAIERAEQIALEYNIKTIAVIPVEFEFIGRYPQNVDSAKWQQTILQQKRFTYQSMYTNLTNYYDYYRRTASQVQFQSLDRTLSLLTENGISDSAAAVTDPLKLASILGVDAVLTMKVTQNRIMSDEAALGANVLGNVINTTIPKANLPVYAVKTGDLYVSCSLVKNGYAVWSNQFRRETDWNRPVQEAIQNATRTIALRFPL
jgi:hypothetical protein